MRKYHGRMSAALGLGMIFLTARTLLADPYAGTIENAPTPTLTPTAADPFPARTVKNEMNMTHERRAAIQRQAKEDQLRRDQVAS